MRILIVKTGSLGDIVQSLPAVRALKAALVQAEIDWLAEARWAPLLQGQGLVNRVIQVDTRAARRRPFSARAAELLWRPLRECGRPPYHAVVDLQRLIKSALMTRLVRARTRYGFAWSSCREPLASLVLNRKARVDYVRDPIRVQYAAPLSLLAGTKLCLPGPPHLEARPEAEQSLARKMPGLFEEPFSVALLGGGFGTKLWPLAHWLELLGRMGVRERVVLPWFGPEEEARADRAASATGAVKAPELSLPELASLLARAGRVVGGDTGPLHLAAALGSPTLSLYGPTLASRNGPPGHPTLQSPLDCAGCVKRRCPKGRADCLEAIGVDRVWEALGRARGNDRKPPSP